MKRIFAIIFSLIVTTAATGSALSPVLAAEGVGAGTNPDCDVWFLSPVSCMQDALLKAAKGALNKQGGDFGTASFSMGQLIIAGMGLCDAQCNPACPRSLSFQNSAVTGLSSTAVAMYQNPPADTSRYIADIGRTLGFRPKVEAQGIGFSGLSALLELWKAFRNIAYALLAAIMIVIGFMVMFRKKIDPKTVVTVQNAIPRIVVALLLVTFSYAIVGVMIDLMYLAIVLAVSVISGASPGLGKTVGLFTTGATCVVGDAGTQTFSVGQVSTQEITNSLFSGGMGKMFMFFMGNGFQAWDDLAAMFTGGFNPKAIISVHLIPGLLGGLAAGPKGLVTGLVSAPLLLTLLILVVLIFGFVRLVFMLLDAYINIIIALLTAPFQLMMEAVPGTNSFANWFKHLLSKILVFPITAILLMVSAILTSQEVSQTMWAPPLISSGSGGFGMAGIIGLGMLLVIPSVVAGIQKGLKAEPIIPGGIAPIVGPLGSGVGQLFSLAYQASFISSAVRHKPDARSAYQVGKEGTEKGLGSITSPGGGGH